MTDESRYYWYIPQHNEIVQREHMFGSTGLFKNRERAIAFVEQIELPVSPDKVVLVEANTTRREDAAHHVGADWDNQTDDEGEQVNLSANNISTAIEQWDSDTRTVIKTLETVAEQRPEQLVEHINSLVERYEQVDGTHQQTLTDIFDKIAELEANQVDPHIPDILDRMATEPTTDGIQALINLLPDGSTHTESAAETIISVLADESRDYEFLFEIAQQLDELTRVQGSSIENVTTLLTEQDSVQAELLGIAALDVEPTSYVDVDTLLSYLDSDNPIVRRATVDIFEQLVTGDSQYTLPDEAVGELQTKLVADWTTNQMETRDQTRSIIAATAEHSPETIAQITDQLIDDIKATVEWMPEDPGYGVVEITKYGDRAANALGRYFATTDSVPTDLIAILVNSGRRRRAGCLLDILVRHSPSVVNALIDYAQDDPESQRKIYYHLGSYAGQDSNASGRAWEFLVNGAISGDRDIQRHCLNAIESATRINCSQVESIEDFLEQFPKLRQYEDKLASILGNLATDNQAFVPELWRYVEANEDNQRHRGHERRCIAAKALADVACRHPQRPEYFDDIDRCIRQIQSDHGRIVVPFLRIIEAVWGDQPEVLRPHFSTILSCYDHRYDKNRLLPLLKIKLTMAKSHPEEVDAEKIHPLIDHDSVEIRELVYEILGYAGGKEAHSLLEQSLEIEETRRARSTIQDTQTRLQVRFSDQFEGEYPDENE